MVSGEFELIERYFSALGAPRDDVVLGVGDDAALLAPAGAARLGIAWDSAAPAPGDDPGEVGERLAESAFRRLLEEGATPAWLTLALTLRTMDGAWAAAFAGGVHRACIRHHACLVGGDTTAGPTAATVLATGPLASS